MTQQQKNKIREVIENIIEIRQKLDEVMYNEPVSDIEYCRLRECYDMICEVNDKLYNV